PDDPSIVYAGRGGSDKRGLYESTDGGTTWQNLTEGLEGVDVGAVALDPLHRTTLYIGTFGEGLFKSTDGGASWQPASKGVPRITVKGTTAAGRPASWRLTVPITALAIDPARPTTLYAATSGKGVLRSTDAGANWHPFNAGLTSLDLTTLAIDASGRTLYAGTMNGGVVAFHTRAR